MNDTTDINYTDMNKQQLMPGDYIIYPVQHKHVVNLRYARITKLVMYSNGEGYIGISAVRKAYWSDDRYTVYNTALYRHDHIVKVTDVPEYVLDIFSAE